MDTFFQDVRFAFRMLLKSPGFTAIALLTLALGIGVNAALFSIVNGVLLNPLPYAQPSKLAAVYQRAFDFQKSSISYSNFLDWQTNNRTFESLAAYRTDNFNLTGTGEPTRVRGDMISWNFFPTLGVKPVLGRNFKPEEDRAGAPPVVLITEGFWKRRFAGASDVLEKSITLNATDYAIVGVIPANFHFGRSNDVFIPMGQWTDPTFLNRSIGMGSRSIGRLKDGVTLSQAQSDMDSVAAGLASEYPEADKGVGIGVYSLKDDMVGDIRPFLFMLLAAVSFVLLIACANVANLLLARATRRTREFAVRSALGASSGRIVRQLLSESVLMGLIAGGLGFGLAAWCTPLILNAVPSSLPRSGEIHVDARVLLFTLGVSILAGVIFGMAPAFRSRRVDLQSTLKEGERGGSGARNRMQHVFVVLEIAMAIVLLIGAGLMIRTLASLWAVDPGFNPHNVLTFDVSLDPHFKANAPAGRAMLRALQQTYSAIPGVEAASVTAGSLAMSSDSELPLWLDNEAKPASTQDMKAALFYLVQPEYLQAMGIQLLRGRFVSAHDDEHSHMVATIDERFAQKYFAGQDPIGRHLNLYLLGDAEIIGIVRHIKQWGLDSDSSSAIEPQMYLPILQIPDQLMPLVVHDVGAIVRTTSSPARYESVIREAVSKLNSQQVMFGAETMDEIIADSLSARRFSMFLLGIFAALALVLASIGVYGVISYLVGERTREIGIRIALGAQRADVLKMVLGEGLKMAGVGVLAGLAAAFALTRLMSKMLYGVRATDPLTFIGVAAVLTIVALAACYIPARRAMKTDPIIALRYE